VLEKGLPGVSVMSRGLVVHSGGAFQRSRVFLNAFLIATGDLFALTLGVWLVFEARGALVGDHTIPKLATVVLPAWLASAWLEGLFPGWGLSPVEQVRRTTRAVLITFLLSTTVLYFTNAGNGWARIALLISGALALLSVLLVRWAMRRVLLKFGVWGEEVVVLGAGETGAALVRNLLASPSFGLRPVMVLDDDSSLYGLSVQGVPIVGPIDLAANEVRAVFVAMPSLSREALSKLLRGSLAGVQRVLIVPDFFGLESQWVEARSVSGLLMLEVQRHLLRPEAQWSKRILDVLGAGIGGLLLLPLFALLALMVFLDSRGAVFFRQPRIGRDGRSFWVFKFRTMRSDAELVLEQYLLANPDLRLEWERDQKLRDDPRVTRLGHWLRRSSLDELPQLLNVLRGEMSLVGPRPIVATEIERYGEWFEMYTRVSPGMAGLWQVSGRNSVSYEERVQLDVSYIRNWSVWLDLVILAKLPAALISSRGAY
jgi:Undecaprenyl-phosphate galactose phosphotransferase WbaP